MALSVTDPQQLADRDGPADTVADIQNGAPTRLSTQSASLTATSDHLAAPARLVPAAAAQPSRYRRRRRRPPRRLLRLALELDSLSSAGRADRQLGDPAVGEKNWTSEPPSRTRSLRKLAATRAEEERKRKAAAVEAAAAAAEIQQQRRGSANRQRTPTDVQRRIPVRTVPAGSRSSGTLPPDPALLAAPRRPRLCGGVRHLIYAAAPGTAVSSGWAAAWQPGDHHPHGIQRGVGLATTYNHMSRIVAGYGSIARGNWWVWGRPVCRPAAIYTSRPARTASRSTHAWLWTRFPREVVGSGQVA